MTNDEENKRLMLAYQAGSEQAFQQLYKNNQSRLFRYIVRVLKDRGAAEDIFQDVWMTVIKSNLSYKAEFGFSFTSWLFCIARSRCMDYFRKNNIKFVPIENEDSESFYCAINSDVAHNFMILKAHERLEHCLTKLPIEQLEVFVLRQESELTIPQIADMTETPLETVKTRLRYALKRLRDCIGDAY